MTAVGWRSGRALWLPVAAFVVGTLVLYPFLYVAFTGPWAPYAANRWVMRLEVVPIA